MSGQGRVVGAAAAGNSRAPMTGLRCARKRGILIFSLYGEANGAIVRGIAKVNNQTYSMTTNLRFAVAAMLAALCVSAQAATYSGNGMSGFGGPVGLGSLTLTDNGTTVFGQVNKGPNGFNDVLVLYINSVAGGFADTSGFADGADGLRKAISGFDGGANRSLMTFGGGFLPDYAIALGPASDNFGGLWGLANGGPNSLGFINSMNLNPVANNNSPTYTFSFNVSDIGIAPNSGATFELFGTYISNSGFRSDEAVAGNDVGAQGWNPFLQTAFASYTIVPEPSAAAVLLVGLSGFVLIRRRQ
jgi:hypothetical protein